MCALVRYQAEYQRIDRGVRIQAPHKVHVRIVVPDILRDNAPLDRSLRQAGYVCRVRKQVATAANVVEVVAPRGLVCVREGDGGVGVCVVGTRSSSRPAQYHRCSMLT